jgi:hypothetical protein
MKLAIVGLSGVLLLTGCGSSPQVEVERNLTDYINCMNEQPKIHKNKVFQSKEDRDDYFFKNCEKYRP